MSLDYDVGISFYVLGASKNGMAMFVDYWRFELELKAWT